MATPSDKTRRLRKYEAAPTVVATDEGHPPLEYFSPFGPLIAKLKAGADLLRHINDYAESRVLPDQGSEFILPQSVIFEGGAASLAEQTAAWIRRYVLHVSGVHVSEVTFEAFWVVSQYASTPSPVHFHSGDLSGVLYLKTPKIVDEAKEEAKTYISGRQAGWINFLIGGKQPLALAHQLQAGGGGLLPLSRLAPARRRALPRPGRTPLAGIQRLREVK